jgi:hypothetical protein
LVAGGRDPPGDTIVSAKYVDTIRERANWWTN